MESGYSSLYVGADWMESQNSENLVNHYVELKKNEGDTFQPALAIITAENHARALEKFHKRDCVILTLNKMPVLVALVNSQNIKEFPNCSHMVLLPEENRIMCKRNRCECRLMPSHPSRGRCASLPQEKNEKIKKWFEYVERQKECA
jgi:hypothetical protein